MNFHQNDIPDRRRRWYIPCRRILRTGGVENAELLIGNTAHRLGALAVIGGVPAVTVIDHSHQRIVASGKARLFVNVNALAKVITAHQITDIDREFHS